MSSSKQIEEEEETEKVCRFCFDEESKEELLQPCACSGGSAYLHLSCLRSWQRRVLVDQHTHPAFWEDDIRHHVCNVCKTPYNCPPPTRLELFASFTGAEIASLLRINRIIGSHAIFSTSLDREITAPEDEMEGEDTDDSSLSIARLRREYLAQSYRHWIRGAYLICNVEPDDGIIELPVNKFLLPQLKDEINTGGRTYKIWDPNMDLSSSSSPSVEKIIENYRLRAESGKTIKVVYLAEGGPSTGEDHIAAVNLARPITNFELCRLKKNKFDSALNRVTKKFPDLPFAKLKVTHFMGGPCDNSEICCCLVMGGNSTGWSIVAKVDSALILAGKRRAEEHGEFFSGSAIKVSGLVSRSDLNGQRGICLRWEPEISRWNVRLTSGLGIAIRPKCLTVMDEVDQVKVFWGDARWTRAQLLGEVARGHWGMVKAGVDDLTSNPKNVWTGLDNRLIFAPITEMSDETMRTSRIQMERMRRDFEPSTSVDSPYEDSHNHDDENTPGNNNTDQDDNEN